MGIKKIKQFTLEALFPEFCLRCSLEGELLCSNCRGAVMIETLARMCPFCDRETCSGATCRHCVRSTSLDGCLALAHYAEPAVKGVVKNWKYASNERCHDIVATWVRRSSVSSVLQDLPWVVVPVGLHPSRARQRGFDQAEIAAHLIGHELSLPVNSVLQRRKRTKSQAALGDRRRKVGELHGAFHVTSDPPPYVLLVDDVLTSGSTLDAAAHELKRSGSELVWGIVLARG
jgi:ComF family protein